jgi:plastocyanin
MAALLGVAFKLDKTGEAARAGSLTARSGTGSGPVVAAVAPASLKLVVKSDEEHGRMGPDGNWHDAFLPADFSVKAGQVVHVTVYNYDDMPHTFTAAALGVNATIPGGSEDKPGEATFTFRAPKKAGSYTWYCAMPCDPWAMSHDGYMRGRVRVA